MCEREDTRARAAPHSSSRGTTLELEEYHTRARAVSHESSCSFTLESTYGYMQCHSPRANTGSTFFRFSQLTTYTIESIAVITYAYSYVQGFIARFLKCYRAAAQYYMRLNLCQKDVAHCTNTESCMHSRIVCWLGGHVN